MVTINLTEVKSKEQIAKIILKTMEINGIKKSELIRGTNLSETAIRSVVMLNESKKDYRLSTLLKILNYLKITIYIGKNEEKRSEVLSLF
ncbi:MAG: helix-turn-helix domain-containing protein [Lutibacter sp.]|uniref:helix-turn-helix domain-containing protein n=1 Tax=Lutibacter sp. TaxID=1925666 RepID=UPI00299E02FB|nr:helix-turn-helix domain-containing protein [Lutibacter sp.]MDX1828692.1 helix-turn-helix domain-containing protein [Lutibacter sp.]